MHGLTVVRLNNESLCKYCISLQTRYIGWFLCVLDVVKTILCLL